MSLIAQAYSTPEESSDMQDERNYTPDIFPSLKLQNFRERKGGRDERERRGDVILIYSVPLSHPRLLGNGVG